MPVTAGPPLAPATKAAPDLTVGRTRPGVVGIVRALIKGMRPKQWVKSVLVLAAPIAAGTILRPRILLETAISVVAFTMCAAAGYLFNDIGDVEADRVHPTKRFRAIASGELPGAVAKVATVVLVLTATLGGGLLTSWRLSAALVAYVVVTVTYSRWLKHQAVVEMLVVALCFLLRPLVGAAGTDVPLSQWFLIVASFGSLYMVAGKRYAEATALGEGASSSRRILAAYPTSYLRQTRELAAAVTLIGYCLWAFQRADNGAGVWSELSIMPIAFGLLRYGLLLERGHGGAPEDVVLSDRPLLAAGLTWAVLFSVGTLIAMH